MERLVWRYALVFLALTVVVGGVAWGWSDESDWWAYVADSERGPWPKFKFHWPEQLVISGIFGMLVAAPVTLALALTQAALCFAKRRTM